MTHGQFVSAGEVRPGDVLARFPDGTAVEIITGPVFKRNRVVFGVYDPLIKRVYTLKTGREESLLITERG